MRWVLVVGLVGLAGCAEQITKAQPCAIASEQFMRSDPEVIIRMTVATTAERCAAYVGRGYQKYVGSVTQPPLHGSAEIASEPTGLKVANVGAAVGQAFAPGNAATDMLAHGVVYRPQRGFVGQDEIRFNLKPQYGSTFIVRIKVLPEPI